MEVLVFRGIYCGTSALGWPLSLARAKRLETPKYANIRER